ncbi:hypothetical protein [Andreprevotia sp. IGB-42]|uniref:hypothetical protein n=1 Tax=Andreprevotia sp. IGB-42 TaxID=2497473 RepID=UPI00135AD097|nr:hypothetical protein [Andreprevotia sp. IGB-42]
MLLVAVLMLACAIAGALCWWAQAKPADPYANDGRQYRDALAQAIRSASRIGVLEHANANENEAGDGQGELLPGTVIPVYAQFTIDALQKQQLLAMAEAMPTPTQDMFSACIFNPHQTFRFYEGAALRSSMVICLECAEVEWYGSKKLPPWALYTGIEKWLLQIGLHPKRDWRALAQQHRTHWGLTLASRPPCRAADFASTPRCYPTRSGFAAFYGDSSAGVSLPAWQIFRFLEGGTQAASHPAGTPKCCMAPKKAH